MATNKIERYSSGDRVAHWILSACFILLLLTGVGLFDKRLSFLFALFGGGEIGIWVHRLSGIVFFVVGMKFFLSHWKDTSTFDEDDKKWLKAFGGYLSKTAEVPPVGRFNAGQKIYGVVATVTAVLFLATGLVMWNAPTVDPQLLRIATLIHSISFVVIAVFFIVHVYMGVFAVQGSLKAMTQGMVSEAWAKKFYPKWYEQVKREEKA